VAATTGEPVVVAGEEPDSVREVSARTKGLLISVPVLVGLGFLLGYPAVIALAVAPLLLVAMALFMVGRRPGGNLRRAIEPSQLTRGETATA
jgi:type III secretory pathway component EscV